MKRLKRRWEISVLIFGLVLAGCGNPTSADNGNGGLGAVGAEMRLQGPVYVFESTGSGFGVWVRATGEFEVEASTGDRGTIIDGMLDIVISSAIDHTGFDVAFDAWYGSYILTAPPNTIVHELYLEVPWSSGVPNWGLVRRVNTPTELIWDEIVYIYVSNVITINAPHIAQDGFVSRAFNVTLQPGWNAINQRNTITGNGEIDELFHRNRSLPWIFDN